MSPRDLLDELGDVDVELLSKRDQRRLRRARLRSGRVQAKRDMQRRVREARRERPRGVVALTVVVVAFGVIFAVGYFNRPMPNDEPVTNPAPETSAPAPADEHTEDHPTPHVVASNWATAFFGGNPWLEFVDGALVDELEQLRANLFESVDADSAAVTRVDWGETSTADGTWTGLASITFADVLDPLTLRVSVSIVDEPVITAVELEEAGDSE